MPRIVAAAIPLFALLGIFAGALLPATQPVLLVVGRVLALLAVGVAAATLLAPDRTKRWIPVALSLALGGLMLEPIVKAVARPLSSPVLETLVPVVALFVALAWWILTRPAASAKVVVVAAVSVSAGVTSAAGFAAGIDFLGAALWSVFAAGIGGVVGLIIVRFGAGASVPTRVSASVLAAGAFSTIVAFAREYAWLTLDDLMTPERQAALLWPALAAAFLIVVAALATLAPATVLQSSLARALVVIPVAAVMVVASSGSTVVLAEPVEGQLAKMVEGKPTDFALAQSMLGEAGAGPRDEFRGKSFYECDAINSRDCFITFYDDLALKKGVAAAVADVVQKTKDDKGVTFAAHCHQVVHNLGQLAFEIADFTDAAGIDPQVCGTGYTHGLWEQQFTALGNEVMFTRTGTLCAELNMVTPWYQWTCSHIIGHMMVTVMMDDPGRAVEYCNQVKDTQAVTDCQAGGWMNFFQDDVVIAHMDREGSLKDLFSVCYGASSEVKFFCYQELFPVIYPLVGGSDYLAAQACLEYSEPDQFEVRSGPNREPWDWDVSYADRCIQGLARGVLVSSFDDYRRAGPRCMSMPEPARDPCLTSTAASVVLNTGSTAAAFQLCRMVSDEGYRTYCYFWSKHSRKLLANGPNNQNLPGKDEIRLPEDGNIPGAPVSPSFTTPEPTPSAQSVGPEDG